MRTLSSLPGAAPDVSRGPGHPGLNPGRGGRPRRPRQSTVVRWGATLAVLALATLLAWAGVRVLDRDPPAPIQAASGTEPGQAAGGTDVEGTPVVALLDDGPGPSFEASPTDVSLPAASPTTNPAPRGTPPTSTAAPLDLEVPAGPVVPEAPTVPDLSGPGALLGPLLDLPTTPLAPSPGLSELAPGPDDDDPDLLEGLPLPVPELGARLEQLGPDTPTPPLPLLP